MSNLLVLGVGPLPVDPVERLFAPGLRTWHFVEMLARRNNKVVVAVIEFGDFTGETGSGAKTKREEAGENIALVRMEYNPPKMREALKTLLKSGRIEGIISTTDLMNGLAVTISPTIPTWLDYNGDPFSEKQLMGASHGNDATLFNQWSLMLPALVAGDRFSTCSGRQRLALLGQLALAGRLNARTTGEELVHAITPCSRAMATGRFGAPIAVKGRLIPNDCFMALWTGGYNNWTDPETLYAGLSDAMARDPGLFYVTTGGEIEGHETASFARFKELVAAGGNEARFRFIGWVPTESIPSCYRQADVAINIDRECAEGELGHRNRLVDWVLHRVPIVTTVACEFAQDLADRGLVWPFEIGNARSLADALMQVRNNPEEAQRRALAAKAYLDEAYDEERLFGPLLDWAERPVRAGDHAEGLEAVAGLARFQTELLSGGGPAREGSRGMGGVLKRLASRFRRSA